MARYHVPPLEALVEKFESLPGIGHKNAQRLAYHVLDMSREDAESFAAAIVEAHEKIHYCSVCCNLTDGDLCPQRESGEISHLRGGRTQGCVCAGTCRRL